MAALLQDVLSAAFVPMCGKWLHIATCLLCSWAKVCPKLSGALFLFEERANMKFM
jgi:hypothetical protein